MEKRIRLLRKGLEAYADEKEWQEGSRGFKDLFVGCNNGVDLANKVLASDTELEMRLL